MFLCHLTCLSRISATFTDGLKFFIIGVVVLLGVKPVNAEDLYDEGVIKASIRCERNPFRMISGDPASVSNQWLYLTGYLYRDALLLYQSKVDVDLKKRETVHRYLQVEGLQNQKKSDQWDVSVVGKQGSSGFKGSFDIKLDQGQTFRTQLLQGVAGKIKGSPCSLIARAQDVFPVTNNLEKERIDAEREGLQADNRKMVETVELASKKLAQANDRQRAAQQKISELTAEMSSVRDQLQKENETLRVENNLLAQNKIELSKEKTSLARKVGQLEQKIKDISNDKSEEKRLLDKNSKLDSSLKTALRERDQLRSENKKLSNTVSGLEVSLKTEKDNSNKAITVLEKRIEDLNKLVSEAASEKQQLAKEKQQLAAIASQIDKKVPNLGLKESGQELDFTFDAVLVASTKEFGDGFTNYSAKINMKLIAVELFNLSAKNKSDIEVSEYMLSEQGQLPIAASVEAMQALNAQGLQPTQKGGLIVAFEIPNATKLEAVDVISVKDLTVMGRSKVMMK